ncbi:MAG TPA: DUF624 domain-containing protein [Clostridia bacterium]|nr:DUF624 domain-containing protein [Clostridia bacterium]
MNFNKPGPGVRKDLPKKRRFIVFFEIYFRKFWKLIQANLLFCAACFPFFIPLLFLLTSKIEVNYIYLIGFLPIAGIGPAIAGFTYILRNFAREQHAFIWMDFRDTYKSNWKQATLVTLINIIVGTVLYMVISFYYANLHKGQLMVVPFSLSLVIAAIFIFVQYYLYTMLITFDLTTRQLYKNAVIFAVVGLGKNIVTTLICGIIVLLIYAFKPLTLALIPFIFLATVGLIISFNSWPLIEKHLMPKTEGDEEYGAETDSEESSKNADQGRTVEQDHIFEDSNPDKE